MRKLMQISKSYSRSQLLYELKNLLDVLGGLLPHVLGLLTAHVCRLFGGNFFSEPCREKSQRKKTSTTPSCTTTSLSNPGSVSRLSSS